MPKLKSAKSLLQLCLQSVCELVIRNCDGNNQLETTSSVNDVVDGGNESASKCVANPFEELHSTLLEQVIDTLGGIRNIKQLNLLTTKQTRKLDLSIVCLINKADTHQALQLAASLECLQYLKLTSVVMFRSEIKYMLGYYQKFLPQFKHLQVLNVRWSSENFDDSCLKLLGIYCIDLRELDISCCNVTDYGIEQLCGGTTVQGEEKLKGQSHGQCKAIRELAIDGTKITFKGVQMALLHLPDLKIFKSSLVVQALRATHQNESLNFAKYALLQLVLKLVNVTPRYLYQNGDLRLAAARCPLVTHLDIGIDFGVTDSDLLGLAVLEGLRSLTLSYFGMSGDPVCHITFDGGLAPLLQARGNSLNLLELKNLPESIPVRLGTIVDCCRNLKRLVLSGIFLMPARLEEDERTSSRPSKRAKSDFVLNYLEELILYDHRDCRYRRHHIKELLLLTPLTLKKLMFSYCDSLDDDILRQVFQFRSFKYLEELAVCSCKSITKDGINLFLDGDNALNRLEVLTCDLVSSSVSSKDIKNWKDQAEKNNWDLQVSGIRQLP